MAGSLKSYVISFSSHVFESRSSSSVALKFSDIQYIDLNEIELDSCF